MMIAAAVGRTKHAQYCIAGKSEKPLFQCMRGLSYEDSMMECWGTPEQVAHHHLICARNWYEGIRVVGRERRVGAEPRVITRSTRVVGGVSSTLHSVWLPCSSGYTHDDMDGLRERGA